MERIISPVPPGIGWIAPKNGRMEPPRRNSAYCQDDRRKSGARSLRRNWYLTRWYRSNGRRTNFDAPGTTSDVPTLRENGASENNPSNNVLSTLTDFSEAVVNHSMTLREIETLV